MLHAPDTGDIVKQHPHVISVAMGCIVLEIAWVAFWVYSYVCIYNAYGASSVIGFCMLVALLWAHEVKKNIVHVTCAGVAGSWYFTPGNPHPVGACSDARAFFRDVVQWPRIRIFIRIAFHGRGCCCCYCNFQLAL